MIIRILRKGYFPFQKMNQREKFFFTIWDK